MPESLSNSGRRLEDILENQISQVNRIISEAQLRLRAVGLQSPSKPALTKSIQLAIDLQKSLNAELKLLRTAPPPDVESDRRMMKILMSSAIPFRT